MCPPQLCFQQPAHSFNSTLLSELHQFHYNLQLLTKMKLHLILAVLGAIPYAAAEVAADAEVAAKAPYNDEFSKLCPNSEQTKGSFCVGGETWTYHCNTQQARQEGWWRFRASTPEACASACAANPDECDKPDWVKSDGYCWIGKVRDSPTHSPGIIAFEKKSSGCEGGQCTLAEPVCEYS